MMYPIIVIESLVEGKSPASSLCEIHKAICFRGHHTHTLKRRGDQLSSESVKSCFPHRVYQSQWITFKLSSFYQSVNNQSSSQSAAFKLNYRKLSRKQKLIRKGVQPTVITTARED